MGSINNNNGPTPWGVVKAAFTAGLLATARAAGAPIAGPTGGPTGEPTAGPFGGPTGGPGADRFGLTLRRGSLRGVPAEYLPQPTPDRHTPGATTTALDLRAGRRASRSAQRTARKLLVGQPTGSSLPSLTGEASGFSTLSPSAIATTMNFSQEEMNGAVVKAAVEMSKHNSEYTFPRSLRASTYNSDFWEPADRPVGIYRVKDGMSAAAAMHDIRNNPSKYAFDCNAAITIIENSAVLDLIGDAAFDQLAQKQAPGGFRMGPNLGPAFGPKVGVVKTSLLGDVETPSDAPLDEEKIPVGAHVYFKNWDVSPEGVDAGWTGENAILIAQKSGSTPPLYYGFPIGNFTKTEVVSDLARFRSANSTTPATLSEADEVDPASSTQGRRLA